MQETSTNEKRLIKRRLKYVKETYKPLTGMIHQEKRRMRETSTNEKRLEKGPLKRSLEETLKIRKRDL